MTPFLVTSVETCYAVCLGGGSALGEVAKREGRNCAIGAVVLAVGVGIVLRVVVAVGVGLHI